MALPIIEVEYFNSYWMKRIYTPQPAEIDGSSTQVPRAYYQNSDYQQARLGGEGNNPWMGIFPISLFEIPNLNTSQKPIIDCKGCSSCRIFSIFFDCDGVVIRYSIPQSFSINKVLDCGAVGSKGT